MRGEGLEAMWIGEVPEGKSNSTWFLIIGSDSTKRKKKLLNAYNYVTHHFFSIHFGILERVKD